MQLRKRERHELESYDEYTRVVTHLDDKTRVIECRDGIQWIIQSASNRSDGRRTWDGRYFCRTKWALLHYAGVKPGDNATLDALPDRFPEGGRGDGGELTAGTTAAADDEQGATASPGCIGRRVAPTTDMQEAAE